MNEEEVLERLGSGCITHQWVWTSSHSYKLSHLVCQKCDTLYWYEELKKSEHK